MTIGIDNKEEKNIVIIIIIESLSKTLKWVPWLILATLTHFLLLNVKLY